MDQLDVDRRDKQRFQLLHGVYAQTRGRLNGWLNYKDLAQRLGLPPRDAKDALDYLVREGLLRSLGSQGQASITHEGVKEVEAALRQPREATPHFMPQHFTINQTFNGQVGAVQNGSASHADVHQEDSSDVDSLISSLRKEASDLEDENDQDEALGCLETLEEEAAKARPRMGAIRSAFDTLDSLFGDDPPTTLSDLRAALNA